MALRTFIIVLCIFVVGSRGGLQPANTFGNTKAPKATATKLASEDDVRAARDNFISNIKQNVQVLTQGSMGLVRNVRKTLALRKLERTQGVNGLSFTDFKFLEQSKADLRKAIRLAVTIPLSPEFFFYSYVVFPLFSSNNPWAWRSLPSTFDRAEDAVTRDRALEKRRMQAVVLGLHSLMSDTADDMGSAAQRAGKVRAAGRITSAMEQKTMGKALEVLEPWLQSKGERAARRLQLGQVPGAVVRQCVRALGGDGVPNIPLVRRFNNVELNGRVRSVGKSDDFLAKKGLQNLSPDEVKLACFERCIRTGTRAEGALREDLAEWLQLTSAKGGSSASTSSGTTGTSSRDAKKGVAQVRNTQNTRLALMALHTARNLRSSPFGAPYRGLMKGDEQGQQ